jgi:rubrerythrin
MKQQASVGANKTGVSVHPLCQEMLTDIEEFVTTSHGSAQDLANVRIAYAKETGADAIGSLPKPTTWTGALKTAMKAVAGDSPTVMLDKLGERLAFERSGVRLYEALLSKYDAYGSFSGGPGRDELLHLLREEFAHFAMLQQIIEQLGGDPTAVTPSANLQATMSLGIAQVLADPRTSLLQSLEAILVAELADNDCWNTLRALAEEAGEEQLASQFQQAFATEQEHLAKVRAWLAAGHGVATPHDGAGAQQSKDEQTKSDETSI